MFNQQRNISDQGLREKGGVTYMHWSETMEGGFEFGTGLSYTSFKFTIATAAVVGLKADTAALLAYHPQYYEDRGADNSPLQLPVVVQNTGGAASAVTVLVFLRSKHVDAPRNGELCGYHRIASLAPGASTTVKVGIPPQVLTLVDARGVERLVPGEYSLAAGHAAGAEVVPATTKLTLAGEPKVVFSLPDARKLSAAL
jgi:hypothetical protein